MREQIERLEAVVRRLGGEIVHVKPHGALYNVAVRNETVARAIAAGIAQWNPKTTVFGLAGSRMLDRWREMGLEVVAEGFADRRYEPDGTLRSRKFPDALITDPKPPPHRPSDWPVKAWRRRSAYTAIRPARSKS